MVTKREAAQREEELVAFLKFGLEEYAKTDVKKTSGTGNGNTYLDITSKLDGSQALILPLVLHAPGNAAKMDQLNKSALHQRSIQPQWILYKDGEEFFRFSGDEGRSGFRKKYARSLREESIETRSKIMLLSDEEKALTTKPGQGAGFGDILYYRPNTDVRGKGLSLYHFVGPAEFVRDPNSRFAHLTPAVRKSTLRFQWSSYKDISTPLTLKEGKLVSAKDLGIIAPYSA